VEFDTLDLRETPVKIAGKDYVLREANGEAARKFRNAVIKAARFNAEGKAERLEGAADAELVLINECLVDASGRKTPIAVLAGWPNRVLRALFQEAKRLSDLDEPESSLADQEKDLAEKLERVRQKREAEGKPTDPTCPPGSASPATSACLSDGA
jgi:hypothetical protein